jgi:hypothetical protein
VRKAGEIEVQRETAEGREEEKEGRKGRRGKARMAWESSPGGLRAKGKQGPSAIARLLLCGSHDSRCVGRCRYIDLQTQGWQRPRARCDWLGRSAGPVAFLAAHTGDTLTTPRNDSRDAFSRDECVADEAS